MCLCVVVVCCCCWCWCWCWCCVAPPSCQEENSASVRPLLSHTFSPCAWLCHHQWIAPCVHPSCIFIILLFIFSRAVQSHRTANDPDVLLLDEPTGDLDTRNTIDVMNLLLAINQRRGVTCVMVTHNPDVECYADRILYIADGRIDRQVLNAVQTPIDFDEYMAFLASTQGDKAH